MRRKNWINKKKYFYGNSDVFGSLFFNIFLKKNKFNCDQYNTNEQLYKVFIKKNKVTNLTFNLNYYFYSDFYKKLKFYSRGVIFKNYIFKNKNIMVFLPSYFFKSQFFSNKTAFDSILYDFKLRGFYLHKNYLNTKYNISLITYKKHLIGYNFFTIKNNLKSYLNIYKILDDKDYNSVGKVKFFLENTQTNFFFLKNELNLFFIFNLFLLNALEFYKILIILYLNKIFFIK